MPASGDLGCIVDIEDNPPHTKYLERREFMMVMNLGIQQSMFFLNLKANGLFRSLKNSTEEIPAAENGHVCARSEARELLLISVWLPFIDGCGA